MQNTLRGDTNRIMEQVTNLFTYVPPEGEHVSPTNIIEFITTGYGSFKCHIDNLFEMLQTLGFLFENSDSLNTQQGQERTLNVGIASKLYESSSQTIPGTHPSYLYGVKDLRGDPDSAEFSSNHSSGSAGSSNVSTVFTQNGNNSSGQPMAGTLTSTSTSHPQESERDIDPPAPIAHLQLIMIRNHSRQTEEPQIGLLDSGTSECFIDRNVVDKLSLAIHQLPHEEIFELFGNHRFPVSEYVEPDWRLVQGQKWHQKDQFFIVDALPNGYHMVIGTVTYLEMGIQFHARKSALVAFPTSRKGSSKGSSYSYASDACMLVNGLYSQALAHKSSSITPYKLEKVLHTGTRRRRFSSKIMQL